ncbi:MAG: hypothetical protein ACU826_09855, partial [Gammaproteobacteria bacterium]
MLKKAAAFASSNLKMPAGLVTLLIALAGITPLCGVLFDCGCTWPWMGLDQNCNINDPAARFECPWCASWAAGGLSVGLSTIAGYCASMYSN